MAEQAPADPLPGRTEDALRPAPGVDRIGDALAPGTVPGGATLPDTEGGHFEPERAAGTPPAASDGGAGANDQGGQGHETA